MILTRIGFDRKIHPYQLQLWLCSFLDILGIQSGDSVILDFRKGVISFCHTDRYEAVTTIREYVASDDDLIELYGFFKFNAIESFEDMPDSEITPYETGYYDCMSLQYLVLSEDGRASGEMRRCIYSNDPIEMAAQWLERTAPFDLGCRLPV